MIELFEQSVKMPARQSSKGNQLKWENDGIWYKADYTGYEGLAEYMVSHLLRHSSLESAQYVLYEPEQIQYKRQIYQGVRSPSFLKGDWQIVTLERLFQSAYGESLNRAIWHIKDAEDRLCFLVEQVERMTGLKEFGKYMNQLFTVDALFLNEDRHTDNIAVLMDGEGKFSYCPVFDNGGALLSDTTMDYPLTEDVLVLMGEAKAKTISTDFDEQLDISEKLYGRNLRFDFTKKEVEELLKAATGYEGKICSRVETILYQQMGKYRYLWKQ